jgi:hypothetical protein
MLMIIKWKNRNIIYEQLKWPESPIPKEKTNTEIKDILQAGLRFLPC